MTALETTLLLALVAVAGYAWWLRVAEVRAAERHRRELAAQREKHEAAHTAQVARMEAMLDGMIEGLVVIDARSHIVLANRAAETMFSFSRMMIGGSLLQAIRHHEIAALAARAVEEGGVMQHEVRLEGAKPRVLQIDPDGGASTTAVEASRRAVAETPLQPPPEDLFRRGVVEDVLFSAFTPISSCARQFQSRAFAHRLTPAA